MEPQAVLRDLLEGVERELTGRGRTAEAALAARLAEVLLHFPGPQAGLDTLYGVHGMRDLALRLMWGIRQMEMADRPLEQERFDDHVRRITGELERLASAAERLRREQPGYLDLPEALQRTGAALGEMNSIAAATPFPGFEISLLTRTADEAGTLATAATGDSRKEIAAFARGLQRFCEFVIDRRLMFDLRCARLITNAHFALQATLETSGADVIDALRQTTHLLNNPETVFV